eukprot:TRINITY_DN20076_c0_g1_i1.p1 TRINITY_DN20076_c0_g1~~TRINITY_DN20076_c0_g1_i1.p1  ORF type:complete len:146 (-),score=12.52 TRINITY_DN20076_c0_g1_i1:239-676(-)
MGFLGSTDTGYHILLISFIVRRLKENKVLDESEAATVLAFIDDAVMVNSLSPQEDVEATSSRHKRMSDGQEIGPCFSCRFDNFPRAAASTAHMKQKAAAPAKKVAEQTERSSFRPSSAATKAASSGRLGCSRHFQSSWQDTGRGG